jgi:transposase InsO family protein
VEQDLVLGRMHQLVAENPRFGYRRIAALLRQEAFVANPKRIHRLWVKEGYKVPVRVVRKRRLGTAQGGVTRLRATAPDQVWAWDFFHDRLEDGRAIKWLACVDEFTRECLLLEPRRSIKATDARDLLCGVIAQRGAPQHIRSDNGPEFIARALREHLKARGINTAYIEPGAPWQNGFAESFNSQVKDELIKPEIFRSLTKARVLGRQWKQEYNTRRPHSALKYLTPEAFAATRRTLPKSNAIFASPRGGKATTTTTTTPLPNPPSTRENSHNHWTKTWGQVTGRARNNH